MQDHGPIYHPNVEECVTAIIDRVGPEIALGIPLALGKPNHLVNAFYRRAEADPKLRLRILTALSLEKPAWHGDLERRLLQPLVARVFGDYPELSYVAPARQGRLPDNIEVMEFFLRPGSFMGAPYYQQNFVNSNYTHAVRTLLDLGMNVAASMVAKAEVAGRTMYSVSCNADLAGDVAVGLRAKADRGRPVAMLGQVNANLPFMYGEAMIPPESFDGLVDDPSQYFRLFGPPKLPVPSAEYMIGLYSSTLVRDGGTIQIGIGSMGDALVYGLQLRHGQNDLYRKLLATSAPLLDLEKTDRIGGTTPFEQGLYGCTEMLVDGFVHLYKSGIIKRKVYGHPAVQRLLDEGRIGEEVRPETLDRLLAEEAVPSRLTCRDFKNLQELGLLGSGLTYQGGAIVFADGTRIPADLEDPRARAEISARGLGPRLQGGYLIHGGFFLGPQSFYRDLLEMSDEDRRLINMTGVSFVNQLYGGEELKTIQRKDGRFFNSAIMVTLRGAAVSDGLADGRIISGVGGQYNFVSMAHALPDGRSVIMVRSTRSHGRKISSNIVFNYGHVTIPSHLRDLVVTEYGVADLRGRSEKDVTARLIEVADTRFQDDLIRQSRKAGKLPRDYILPDWARANRPEVLEQRLAGFKKQGLFPTFPFGTDLTQEEVVLGGALKKLRQSWFSAATLGRLLTGGAVPAQAEPYLARMELDRPRGIKEKLMRQVVVYALMKAGKI